jgi:molecular chaperone DnaK
VQQLKVLAERAKREVSSSDMSRISTVLLPDSKHPIPIETMLTRAFFERLVRPKTEHALAIVERALNDANLKGGEVDTVLLVGGMTRVPLLRELVAKHFGKEADARVDPDEAVALGAAIHAAELVEQRGNTLLLDVLGSSLGVEVAGGLVKPLLARNTMLPCHATETFFPGRDGQTQVRVPIVQGESKRGEENVRVGEILLGDMTATLRREHPLEVTFAMNAQGLLSVSVSDKLSGKTQEVNVDQRANLQHSEQQALAAKEDAHRAAQNSVDAEERRANRHARRALHGVLVAVRRLQRELQHVAREAEEADARQMADTLSKEILAADLVERTGSRKDLEAMTEKLLKLLEGQ